MEWRSDGVLPPANPDGFPANDVDPLTAMEGVWRAAARDCLPRHYFSIVDNRPWSKGLTEDGVLIGKRMRSGSRYRARNSHPTDQSLPSSRAIRIVLVGTTIAHT